MILVNSHGHFLPVLPGALDLLATERIDALRSHAAATRLSRNQPARRRVTPRRRRADAEPVFLGGRPPTGAEAFARWSGLLAAHVAEHGIATAERAVAAVARLAARRGATTPALEVLADRREPAVARARALGIVLRDLDRAGQRTRTSRAEVA